MKIKEVTSINGVKILASEASEGLVPVKPICEALKVDYPTQFTKLKEHPIYASVIGLSPATGTDGKRYDMLCIPIEFLSGWLFSINPANVKEEAREGLIRYQIECNRILFHHFFGSQKIQIEQNAIEINLLEEIADLNQQKNSINGALNEKKKMLENIRAERLKNEPRLFEC